MTEHVSRTAGFREKNGMWSIVQVNVQCDPGNHFIPHWDMRYNINGREFHFKRPAGKNNCSGLYIESDKPFFRTNSNDDFDNVS